MNNLTIMKGRTRALLTDFASLTIIIVAVIVSVYISGYSDKEMEKSIRIEVVNEDTGELGAHLVDILGMEKEFEFLVDSKEDAKHEVAVNNAQGMVEIAPDFTEKLMAGDYDSLIKVTAMADSYDMTVFTEMMINDTIKVWTEVIIEKEMGKTEGVDESHIEEFRERAFEVWKGEPLLDIEAFAAEEKKDTETAEYYGIRWYAVFTMFYLLISGTWMCGYLSTGLLKRVIGRDGKISLLFIFQSFPGIMVSITGFIPVLVSAGHPHPLKVFASFVIYACGTEAVALVVCSLSGGFSNLILSATVVTMAGSLFSGLVCDLPDWARVWDITSVFLPGHWYFNAICKKTFLLGSLSVTALWFFAGMFTSWKLGVKKEHE